MSLRREEVLRLGELARIAIYEEEVDRVGDRLDRVLAYVDRLQAIDTKDVPETEPHDAVGTLRPDAPTSREGEVDLILQNFPDHVGVSLRVPAVFEAPKG